MPCNHYGKTPPCSQTIIDAKISQIHIANCDPSISKKEIENKFKKHNIKIFYDFPKDLVEKIFTLNLGFYKCSILQTPFFTLKYAMTADGKIATQNLSSKWISNSYSRANVQQERAQHDAICVGQNTLLQDNPRLTIRLAKIKNLKQPLIVLPLSRDCLREELNIFKQKEVVFIVKKKFSKSIALIKKYKKNLIFYQNFFFSKKILTELISTYQINSIFVEGGSHLQGELLQQGLIDKVSIYLTPRLLGDGKGALSPFNLKKSKNIPSSFPTTIAETKTIHFAKVQLFAADLHLQGYLTPKVIKQLKKKIIVK